jgi:hypothetical protein
MPWRALPEWKLTREELRGLHALVIPSAEVFPAEDVPALAEWVRGGGGLIIAGESGRRLGEAGNFDVCAHGSTLAALTDRQAETRQGRVLRLGDDPGRRFYAADRDRPSLLSGFESALASVWPTGQGLALTAKGAPWQTGIALYRCPGRLFVDVNNTAIDLAQDAITPSAPMTLVVTLPAELRGKALRARVLAPGAPPAVRMRSLDAERLELELAPVEVYACVVIEKNG